MRRLGKKYFHNYLFLLTPDPPPGRQGPVGIKFLSCMSAVISKLLDEIFIGIAQFILWHCAQAQGMSGKMLNKVFQGGIRQVGLVSPGGISKYPGQTLWIGSLYAPEGIEQCKMNLSL